METGRCGRKLSTCRHCSPHGSTVHETQDLLLMGTDCHIESKHNNWITTDLSHVSLSHAFVDPSELRKLNHRGRKKAVRNFFLLDDLLMGSDYGDCLQN